MTVPAERVSDEVLQDIMHGEFLHHHPLVHYRMAQELIDRRRADKEKEEGQRGIISHDETTQAHLD